MCQALVLRCHKVKLLTVSRSIAMVGESTVFISALDKDDNSLVNMSVSDGEEFDLQGEFSSNTVITLQANGKTQTIEIHTSCSAPLLKDDQFGHLQLIGFRDNEQCGF